MLKDELGKILEDSVKIAFSVMLSVPLDSRDLSVEEEAAAELICTVGIAGKLEGSVSLLIPNTSACAIVSLMLQENLTEITRDVCDGMCEVTNLIAGGIKTRAVPFDVPFNISIPTIVQGKLMHVSAADDLAKIRRRFSGGGFSFDVDMVYKIHAAHPQEAANGSGAGSNAKLSALEKLRVMTAKAKSNN